VRAVSACRASRRSAAPRVRPRRASPRGASVRAAKPRGQNSLANCPCSVVRPARLRAAPTAAWVAPRVAHRRVRHEHAHRPRVAGTVSRAWPRRAPQRAASGRVVKRGVEIRSRIISSRARAPCASALRQLPCGSYHVPHTWSCAIAYSNHTLSLALTRASLPRARHVSTHGEASPQPPSHGAARATPIAAASRCGAQDRHTSCTRRAVVTVACLRQRPQSCAAPGAPRAGPCTRSRAHSCSTRDAVCRAPLHVDGSAMPTRATRVTRDQVRRVFGRRSRALRDYRQQTRPEPRAHACVAAARTLRADPRRGIAPTAVARCRARRARRCRVAVRVLAGSTHALSFVLTRSSPLRTRHASTRGEASPRPPSHGAVRAAPIAAASRGAGSKPVANSAREGYSRAHCEIADNTHALSLALARVSPLRAYHAPTHSQASPLPPSHGAACAPPIAAAPRCAGSNSVPRHACGTSRHTRPRATETSRRQHTPAPLVASPRSNMKY
jgi:hypothetical protein